LSKPRLGIQFQGFASDSSRPESLGNSLVRNVDREPWLNRRCWLFSIRKCSAPKQNPFGLLSFADVCKPEVSNVALDG